MILGLTDPSGAAATWRAYNSHNSNNVYTRASSNAEFRQQGNQPRIHNAFNYKKQDIVGLRGNAFNEQNDTNYWRSYQLGPNIRNPLGGGARNAAITNEGVYNINPIAGTNAFGGGLVSAASGLNPTNYSLARSNDIDDRIRAGGLNPNNPLSAQYAKNLAKDMSPLHNGVAEGADETEADARINNFATPASLIRQAQSQVAMGYDVAGIESQRPIYVNGEIAKDEDGNPMFETYTSEGGSTDPEAISKLKAMVQEEATKAATGASNSEIFGKYENYLKNLPKYNYTLDKESQIITFQSAQSQEMQLDSGASDPGILAGLQNMANPYHANIADSNSLSRKTSAANNKALGRQTSVSMESAESEFGMAPSDVSTANERNIDVIDSGSRGSGIIGNKRGTSIYNESSKRTKGAVNTVARLNRMENGMTLDGNDTLQGEIRDDNKKASLNYSVIDSGNGVEEVMSDVKRYNHDALIKFNLTQIDEQLKAYLSRAAAPSLHFSQKGVYRDMLEEFARKCADILENHGIAIDFNAFINLIHPYLYSSAKTNKPLILKAITHMALQFNSMGIYQKDSMFDSFKKNFDFAKWEQSNAEAVNLAKHKLKMIHQIRTKDIGYVQGKTVLDKNVGLAAEIVQGSKQSLVASRMDNNSFAGINISPSLIPISGSLSTASATLQDRGTLPATTPIFCNLQALPLITNTNSSNMSYADAEVEAISSHHKTAFDMSGVYDDITAISPLIYATNSLMASIGGMAKTILYTTGLVTLPALQMGADSLADGMEESGELLLAGGRYAYDHLKTLPSSISGGIRAMNDRMDQRAEELVGDIDLSDVAENLSNVGRGIARGGKNVANFSAVAAEKIGRAMGKGIWHAIKGLQTAGSHGYEWVSKKTVYDKVGPITDVLHSSENPSALNHETVNIAHRITDIAKNSSDSTQFEVNVESLANGLEKETGLPFRNIRNLKVDELRDLRNLKKKIHEDLRPEMSGYPSAMPSVEPRKRFSRFVEGREPYNYVSSFPANAMGLFNIGNIFGNTLEKSVENIEAKAAIPVPVEEPTLQIDAPEKTIATIKKVRAKTPPRRLKSPSKTASTPMADEKPIGRTTNRTPTKGRRQASPGKSTGKKKQYDVDERFDTFAGRFGY